MREILLLLSIIGLVALSSSLLTWYYSGRD